MAMRTLERSFGVLLVVLLALGCSGPASDSSGEGPGPEPTPSPGPSPTPSPTPEPGTGDRPDGAILLYAPAGRESAQNPAFSPDGQTILFTIFHRAYNEGPAGMFLLSLAGGDPAALLDEADQDSVNLPGSSWNGATGRITFASDREDREEIWTMTAGGSDLFRVTRHATSESYLEPSYSTDGQWIVFEADSGERDEDRQRGSIWKVRADGTELTRLTGGPGGGTDDRQPNWSPDGGRILFQRRDPEIDNWDIYTLAPDGTDIRQVTADPSSDTDANWSPDGARIVYSSDYGGLRVPSLFVVPAGGGAPVRATNDDTHGDGAASWSPDGGWIAFESYPAGGESEKPASLWRIAAPAQ